MGKAPKCEFCDKEAEYKVTVEMNHAVSYVCKPCLDKKKKEINKNANNMASNYAQGLSSQFNLNIGGLISSLMPNDIFDSVAKVERLKG